MDVHPLQLLFGLVAEQRRSVLEQLTQLAGLNI
jgi:hypothetical protein